jgi:lysine-N-methylase
LPCRIYPYAFHPAGKQTAVSLRFSCPSVVANKGRAVTEQQTELRMLAGAVVPGGAGAILPPAVSATEKVDWPDFMSFIAALDATFANPESKLLSKLLQALFWMRLVGQSKFDSVRGERLHEFLELITTAGQHEVEANTESTPEPSRAGRLQFRMLVAQYARKDTLASSEGGWGARWRLLRSAMRFARGTGNIPPLREGFREVPFSALEQEFGGVTPEAEEILTRYFRVKIQGLSFCGPAYYDVPLVEGFQSLALVFPSVLWLSRWLATGEGRCTLSTDDVVRALAAADHQHGYSPVFGHANFRRRVRSLALTNDIARLSAWYAR